jgi:rubrerythrin
MVQRVVSCPYCVSDNDFREMVNFDGRFFCKKCGHMSMPDNPDFKCPCPKCWDLSFPANLGARAS